MYLISRFGRRSTGQTIVICITLALAMLVVVAIGSSLPAAGTERANSLVITGQVVERGQSIVGASVVAQAWPRDEHLSGLATGASFDLFPIASTTSGQSGLYSMALDLSVLPPLYRSPAGQVDLQIIASASGKRVSWSFSHILGQTANSSLPALDIDLGVEGATPHPCGGAALDIHGPYQTKLANVYAEGNVVGRATYAHGGSTATTLGVALQGAGGGWFASGTQTKSASAGFVANNLKDRGVYGLWRYRDYVVCGVKWTRPFDYVGRGQTTYFGTHPDYNYCGSAYYAGDRYFRNIAANHTFSTGLTVYGVGLSSQAGWSSSMTLEFIFSSTGNVCGNTSQRELAPLVEASA
jgi:hypothetical protein